MQAETIASQAASPGAAPVDNVPAGLARRLAALAYDCVLLLALVAIYGGVIVTLRAGAAVAPNTAWFSLGLFAIPAVFFCWFWTHGGQTLGMLAWRLRVVTLNGRPPRISQAAARFAAAWLSLLAFGLGFLWALWDPQSATWHDRLSGTRMIRVTPHSH